MAGDGAAVVGVAGIVTAGIIGPVVVGWVQRRNDRAKHLVDRRSDAYLDMLDAVQRALQDAAAMAESPAIRIDPDHDDWNRTLRRADAAVRAFGSLDVRNSWRDLQRGFADYWPAVGEAVAVHATIPDGKVDTHQSIQARIILGRRLEQLRRVADELEGHVRNDLTGQK